MAHNRYLKKAGVKSLKPVEKCYCRELTGEAISKNVDNKEIATHLSVLAMTEGKFSRQ